MQNFSCSALLRCRLGAVPIFGYGTFTLCGGIFQFLPLIFAAAVVAGPTTPAVAPKDNAGLGWCAFARRYLRNRFCFLFLRVMRCFSSPGSPTFVRRYAGIASGGLPHSDIRASTGICPSARLFAACRVLRRLREPRHPSCAFSPFRFFVSP